MYMHGPTEAAVDCAYYIIDNGREYTTSFYPVGWPGENTEIIIRKGNGLAKTCEIREICVHGTALARGYCNVWRQRTSTPWTQ